MSSKTEFKCDFCKQEISDGATIHGNCGFCLNISEWTRKLSNKYQGPHICLSCAESLSDVIDKMVSEYKNK